VCEFGGHGRPIVVVAGLRKSVGRHPNHREFRPVRHPNPRTAGPAHPNISVTPVATPGARGCPYRARARANRGISPGVRSGPGTRFARRGRPGRARQVPPCPNLSGAGLGAAPPDPSATDVGLWPRHPVEAERITDATAKRFGWSGNSRLCSWRTTCPSARASQGPGSFRRWTRGRPPSPHSSSGTLHLTPKKRRGGVAVSG
jgi:hypothetical protein